MKTRGFDVVRRKPSFVALLCVQVLVACAILLMSILPAMQKLWMKNMHLTSSSFVGWVAVQFVPKMYSFDNEIFWIWEDDGQLEDVHFRLNHYPLRLITFDSERNLIIKQPHPSFLEMRSSYRGVCNSTRYIWEFVDENSTDAIRLTRARVEKLTC